MLKPTTDSPDPSRSSLTFTGGTSLIRRKKARMTSTRSYSPANTYRHDAKVVTAPPISGPAATAIAPAAASTP